MIFKSDKGKSFTQEEAIDLMVSLSATDANSKKKWREVSITLYRRQNCRMSGMRIGKRKDIKKGVRLKSPHFC